MKSMLRNVHDKAVVYKALMFICPGCALEEGGYGSGLHMLPVNSKDVKSPSWEWDEDLEAPTLSPSIKTTGGSNGKPYVCHSFLRQGIFEFLSDSTHSLAGQYVSIPDLPEWVISE